MYLLAEDEGNEEEIMRLLEATPPPSQDVVPCDVEGENSSCHSDCEQPQLCVPHTPFSPVSGGYYFH